MVKKVIIRRAISDRKVRDIFRSDPVLQSGFVQEQMVLFEISFFVHLSPIMDDPQVLIGSESANIVFKQPSVGQFVSL